MSTVQKTTQSIKGNEVKGNMLQIKEQDKSPEPILMKHLSDKDFQIKVTKMFTMFRRATHEQSESFNKVIEMFVKVVSRNTRAKGYCK